MLASLSQKVAGVLLLASIAISLYFYGQLPDSVAIHWNVAGEVDKYASKQVALSIFPILMAFLVLLFNILPKLDPLKKNIKNLTESMANLSLVIAAFILVVQTQVILWNAGIKISPVYIIPIGFAIIFYYMGHILENSERNYFLGIRTPWTLSSDEIWQKTHKLGAKMFKVSSLFSITALVAHKFFLLLLLGPILLTAVVTSVYSLVLYKKKK